MKSEPLASSETGGDAPKAAIADGGITLRVVLLSLVLAAFFGTVISIVDYKLSNTYLGATHLPPGAIAVVLALVLVVNPLLGLLSRRWRFSRNEILSVYMTCLFSCLVPGISGNNYFVPFSIGPFYYAKPENKWLDLLQGLPPWMTPALGPDGNYRASVVNGFYQGLGPGESIPWSAWLVPLLSWSALYGAIFVFLACIGVILRAQWGEREALAFPLLRLPLELTADEERPPQNRFFRNPLMWCGFGVAALVQLVNGLHLYFPDVPEIPLRLDIGPLFTEAPWNQIGVPTLRIFPLAVGISFLLTSEVSFSLWFFYWLFKLQFMAAYYAGFVPSVLPQVGSQKVFTGYQEVGAYLGFAALTLWTGREHFAYVMRRALGRVKAARAERDEALSYPVAFWGAVVAFGFLIAWSLFAGLSLALALGFWLGYLVLTIALTRVVAESGLLLVHHHWIPTTSLAGIFNSGPGTLVSVAHGSTPAALLEYSIMDMRGSLLPSFVQSFKLAHDHGIRARPLLLLIGAVIGLTFAITLWMNVRLAYENGALSLHGWAMTRAPNTIGANMKALDRVTPDAAWTNSFWLFAGVLTTWLIMAARSRLAAFPFHPVGYLMAISYAMNVLWLSVFLGWLFKTLVMRFGGHESYRKLTPAFLGLVLGDVAMMLFWLVIDGWQGRTGHNLMPG